MKKLGLALLAVFCVFSGTHCATYGKGQKAAPIAELALVTDTSTIDDNAFIRASWEGLVQIAKEKNSAYHYFRSEKQDEASFLAAIDLAVQHGAKMVVAAGIHFEVPLFIAQDRYPDIRFILVDSVPRNQDGTMYRAGNNTVGILFAEDQAGFLAGYAAVKDGYRKLGFMGGIAVPAVIRFGHGYIQGAEEAAKELGLPDGSIAINYMYTNTFEPSPDIQTRAATWYNDGIEVIFSCGGGICNSIFTAADQAGGKVIGVDGDQSSDSSTVITSAMKMLKQSVYDKISDFYNNTFPGGQQVIYAAENKGVGLPMENSRFENFSQAQYDEIFEMLADGSIVVDNNTEIEPNEIPTQKVAVNNLG